MEGCEKGQKESHLRIDEIPLIGISPRRENYSQAQAMVC